MNDYVLNGFPPGSVYSSGRYDQGYNPDSEVEARYHDFYALLVTLVFEDFMDAFSVLHDPKSSRKELKLAGREHDHCLSIFDSEMFLEFCDLMGVQKEMLVNMLEERALKPARCRLPAVGMLERDEYFNA